MIGSALDLDSLSGEEDQNSKHINNAQDSNNCDESNFVTTKASSLSEQCKTAGISTIYQDNDRRKSGKAHSTRSSGISGTGKMYRTREDCLQHNTDYIYTNVVFFARLARRRRLFSLASLEAFGMDLGG